MLIELLVSVRIIPTNHIHIFVDDLLLLREASRLYEALIQAFKTGGIFDHRDIVRHIRDITSTHSIGIPVPKPLLPRCGAQKGLRRRVCICRVRDARRAAEIAVSEAYLRLLARPDGTPAVILLAEVVTCGTHRFGQPPEREVPVLRMMRHIRRVEACMIQPLRLRRVCLRIDTRRAPETAEDGNVRILIKPRIHPRTQALLKAMIRLLEIVLICSADARRRCDAHLGRLHLPRKAVPPPAVVPDHPRSDLLFHVKRRDDKACTLFQSGFVRCRTRRTLLRTHRHSIRIGTELQIDPEPIHPLLEGAFVVAMVENIIDPDIGT